jgi:apolipoprotein N-acyltransferase
MNKLRNVFRNHYYLFTAPLMFLSFPSFDVWILKGFPFFAWIFMVPLFIHVRDKSLKRVYISSFITGLLGNFLTYEWIGNFAGGQTGGYAVIVGFLIPSLSVFFAMKVFLAEMLSRRWQSMRFIIYPLIWIFIDWIQSIGYLAFPWTNVAHSQYTFSGFMQAASIAGVSGISFIMIMVSSSMAETAAFFLERRVSLRDLIRESVFRRTAGLVAAVIAISIGGTALLYRHPESRKSDLRVAMVQSCIDPWESWETNRDRYLKELIYHSDEALREKPDFLIWSESATLEPVSYFYAKNRSNDFQRELLNYVKRKGVPLFTGEIGVMERPGGFFMERYPQNNGVLIDSSGEPARTYSKINLVPFGEWFPYEKAPLIGKPVKNLAGSYGGSSFVPGKVPELFQVNGYRFAPLICYEGIFYRLCRTYRRMGADFLVNISNDGWSHTYRGHMQHFSALVFRSVENGLWSVRAGNTGFTAVIDPYGRVTSSIPILTRGYALGDLDFSMNHDTFYSRHGFLIQIFFLALTAALFIRHGILSFSRRALRQVQ